MDILRLIPEEPFTRFAFTRFALPAETFAAGFAVSAHLTWPTRHTLHVRELESSMTFLARGVVSINNLPSSTWQFPFCL